MNLSSLTKSRSHPLWNHSARARPALVSFLLRPAAPHCTATRKLQSDTLLFPLALQRGHRLPAGRTQPEPAACGIKMPARELPSAVGR
jgi:hypothetical protein